MKQYRDVSAKDAVILKWRIRNERTSMEISRGKYEKEVDNKSEAKNWFFRIISQTARLPKSTEDWMERKDGIFYFTIRKWMSLCDVIMQTSQQTTETLYIGSTHYLPEVIDSSLFPVDFEPRQTQI